MDKYKELRIVKNIMKAFTLAEMMIVLLVISLVLIAFTPVISIRQKQIQDAASEGNIWESAGVDIFYGKTNQERALIGEQSFQPGDSARLLINTVGAQSDQHILFKQENSTTGHLILDSGSNIGLGDVAAFQPASSYQIEIGPSSLVKKPTASADGAIAIGRATTAGSYSTAIGAETTAGSEGVAIGYSADSTNGQIAIGQEATTINSTDAAGIAIGPQASAGGDSSIYIGSDNSRASMPTNGVDLVGAIVSTPSLTVIRNAINISASSLNRTAIGYDAMAVNDGDTAIGYSAHAQSLGGTSAALAIGQGATVGWTCTDRCIAIGWSAEAGNNRSAPLGPNFTDNPAVVIGSQASRAGVQFFANAAPYGIRNIVFGGGDTSEVDIPGKLYINNIEITRTSDRRLKNIKKPFVSGLDKLRQIKVYDYTFKKDLKNTQHAGVMAQDLKKIFPDAVTKGDKGYLSIRKDEMFYSMLNSLKQLDFLSKKIAKDVKSAISKIERTEKKIAALMNNTQRKNKKILELKAKNKALDSRISALEKLINK